MMPHGSLIPNMISHNAAVSAGRSRRRTVQLRRTEAAVAGKLTQDNGDALATQAQDNADAMERDAQEGQRQRTSTGAHAKDRSRPLW